MSAAAGTRRRSRRGEGASLRADVLSAARDLLSETGSEEAVSIRAVAERVGVTAPSIYLHFADKDALLGAVCEDVFASLDAAMEAAAAETDDPFSSLRARGLAYVRFATENPEHYRIVFMRRPAADELSPDPDVVTSGAFAHLLDAVTECQRAGFFAPDDDAVQVACVLWAAAHGIASLLIAKPGFPWPAVEALVTRTIEAVGMGAAVSSHATGKDPKRVVGAVRRLR